MTRTLGVSSSLTAEAALAGFQQSLDVALTELLTFSDEQTFDPRWTRALSEMTAYALRPAKRVRPTLLMAGYALARGELLAPRGVQQFACGLELLHTFMLIHDDVADRATTRRGGPTLHLRLAPGKSGEDLAVVMGDHLYARAIEAMLASGLPGASGATRYMMEICRHTAVGQFLDIDLGRAPLCEVTLFQALKVAHLKTAKYGFVAPLVVGAMLGGADRQLLDQLERVGRQAGLAFQLRDDLIGLFGDDTVAGKSGGGDFAEAKRTFPVIAGWIRADARGRAELERLWSFPPGPRHAGDLEHARKLVQHWGGKSATERVVARMTRSAQRSLSGLPNGGGARSFLDGLLGRLSRRAS